MIFRNRRRSQQYEKYQFVVWDVLIRINIEKEISKTGYMPVLLFKRNKREIVATRRKLVLVIFMAIDSECVDH